MKNYKVCSGSKNVKKMFGLLMNSFISRYELGIWQGIKKYLAANDVGLKCFISGTVIPSYPIYYTNVIYDMISSTPLDGLIVISSTLVGDFKLQHYKESSQLNSYFKMFSPLPIVSIGSPVDGIPSIVVDNRKGMEELLDHFIIDHKKRKIAFIHGTPGVYDAGERFETYKAVLKKHNIKYDDRLVVYGNFSDKASGATAVNILLFQRKVSFDAVIAASDEMAITALQGLYKNGIKTPEDVIVGGFDNIIEGNLLSLPLTTINHPVTELGYTAAQTLHKILKNQKVEQLIMLPTEFIKRSSCTCQEKRPVEEIGSSSSFGIRDEHGFPLPECRSRLIDSFNQRYLNVQERMKNQNIIIKSLYPVTSFSQLKIFLERSRDIYNITECRFMLFDEKNHEMILEDGTSPFSLLPANKSGTKNQVILSPFYNEESSYGLVILRASGEDVAFYELLAIQIGSVISRILLFSRIQQHAEKLEKEVVQRTAELEETNIEKTKFFVNLAHETKTPLTLIKNYMEKYILENEINDDLRIIKKNIDILLRNMVNFLDAEKLNRGQVFYDHNQQVNLSDLVYNKVILFKEIAKKKHITIHSYIESDIFVKTDPYAADRIVNNLVDNSIKYTGPNGEIHITLKLMSTKVLLEVRDTGVGMSPEQMENVFLPYHQLSSKKRNIQGIGMGLYIVKKILDSLGSEIVVNSTPGEGTVFTVVVEKDGVNSGGVQYRKTDVSVPMDTTSIVPEVKETVIKPGMPFVLIVDDNPEMLFFLQTFLSDEYNICLAENGARALKKLQVITKPDLIISDIMMDEMDGHELLSALAQSERFSDIPLVFLTAKSSSSQKIRGLRDGAVDYIFKPFLVEELKAKMEAILNNKSNMEKRLYNVVKKKIVNIFDNLDDIQEKPKENILPPEKFYRNYKITRRERDVLELVMKGFYNKEVSANLNISLKTVEFHLYNIYQKLKVQNKVELSNFVKEYLYCTN